MGEGYDWEDGLGREKAAGWWGFREGDQCKSTTNAVLLIQAFLLLSKLPIATLVTQCLLSALQGPLTLSYHYVLSYEQSR